MNFLIRPRAPWVLRVVLAAVVAGVAVLAGCSHVPGGAGPVQTPKNIIIMFADGAAPTQWDFGRY